MGWFHVGEIIRNIVVLFSFLLKGVCNCDDGFLNLLHNFINWMQRKYLFWNGNIPKKNIQYMTNLRFINWKEKATSDKTCPLRKESNEGKIVPGIIASPCLLQVHFLPYAHDRLQEMWSVRTFQSKRCCWWTPVIHLKWRAAAALSNCSHLLLLTSWLLHYSTLPCIRRLNLAVPSGPQSCLHCCTLTRG